MKVYLGNQAMVLAVNTPPSNSVGVFYSLVEKTWVWWYCDGDVFDAGDASSESDGLGKAMLNFKRKTEPFQNAPLWLISAL